MGTEGTDSKISEGMRKHWEEMTEEERAATAGSISQGMKAYWEKLDSKRRREIGKKIAEGRRRAAQLRKQQREEEKINGRR